jgi:phosphopantothenoylcysteine decarboxylase/phosphopantothenate--cysteine ligase
MLIANHGPSTFGKDENQISIIDANGIFALPQSE